MSAPRIGSVCSGIGGLELGLEWAGLGKVAWQVEIDPWCRQRLAWRWPQARQWDDLRTFPGWDAEIMCGGIPCQPHSKNGNQERDADDRELTRPFVQTVGVVRPKLVVLEEVDAYVDQRGLGLLLGGFASIGYDAQWDVIPASAVGAPQGRARVWVVAYPHRGGHLDGQPRIFPTEARFPALVDIRRRREAVSNANGGRQSRLEERNGASNERQEALLAGLDLDGRPGPGLCGWPAEPGVHRMAHGLPEQVDRLRALGNAVVPAVARYVGGLIMAAGYAPVGNLGDA